MKDDFISEIDKNYNRNGKFLFSVIFAFIFGLLGAAVGIYLIFNTFKNDNNVQNFFGLKKDQTHYVESKDNNSKVVANLEDFNNTSVGVAKKVIPSIVNIDIQYDINTVFKGKATTTGTGSGVILSNDGYVLTNNHVVSPQQENSFYAVSEAKKITVTLSDDKEYDAEIVGVDKLTDLAVIKLKDAKDLTPATLGNSDNLNIGEFVMAIGSPLGFRGSVTNGIISSINRKVTLSDGNTLVAIQTNASINSGNSGGALVNSKGEVIGINTLKLAGGGIEGLGFAIPINNTKNIVEKLIKNGKVERPSLGFSGKEISEELSKEYGLPQGILVKEIMDNSTAKNIGLKQKDIVIKLNGKDVKSFKDIENIKTDLKVDDEITITIIRDGKEKELKGKLIKFEIPKENTKPTEKRKEKVDPKENKEEEFRENREKLFEYFFGE